MSATLRPVPTSPFACIPAELRQRAQWVCWKGDKVPVNPRDGTYASVTNPTTWATFDEACTAASAYSGIGFVFSADDPYTGIDIDATNDPVIRARHEAVYQTFNSYSEHSISGLGLHIIVRGDVPTGRRRDKIEVYSSGRFFVMTGDVVNDVPIAERQELLSQLHYEMAPAAATLADASVQYRDATEADDAIYERAASAANGDKFVRLWSGDGSALSGNDKSGSAIDQGIVDIVAFYTDDPAQIERLWLRSPQGQRDKTRNRADYRQRTIAMAFDRKFPVGNFDAITGQIKVAIDAAKLPTPTAGILPTIIASDLAGKPVRERAWHVEGMVPAHTVTLLSGDGGTGKSLIALQLAVATVADRAWLGTAVRAGGCLFLTAEDDMDEVYRRLVAIAAREGVPLESLCGLALSSLAGRDALLAVLEARAHVLTPTALLGELREHIGASRPALIVLDTSADLYGGGESERAQVRQFVGMLRGIALDFQTTVLLLSHPSLTGMSSGSGLSGSTAWNNSVRSRLYLKHDEANGDVRILRTMKSNYGRIGQELRLAWRDGVFAEIGRTAGDALAQSQAEFETDQLFLQLLGTATAQGRHVSASPSSPDYAPKAFTHYAPGKSHKAKGFAEAMQRLFASGRIREGYSDGPPSRRKRIIVLGDAPETTADLATPPTNPRF